MVGLLFLIATGLSSYFAYKELAEANRHTEWQWRKFEEDAAFRMKENADLIEEEFEKANRSTSTEAVRIFRDDFA